MAKLGIGLFTGALVASALTLVVSGPAHADDPVAGALTSGDSLFPHQGNGGYDALHYDVRLTVNVAVSATNNAVATTTLPEASTSMRATTTGAPLSSFGLDFQGSTGNLAASTLDVGSVTVNGAPATFSRIESTTPTNVTTDVHKIVVTPATPVSGEFTTVVTYSGTPVRHTDADGSAEGWNNTTDGATFVNQPVGSMTAFPNNNTPSDKATYTFTVDAPSRLTTSAQAVAANPGLRDAAVASNGELVSRTPSPDGTRTTWVWEQTRPMASMLALVSVGRYDVHESDITLASGRTLHEWTFIDPAISAQSQLVTQATRAQTKQILDHLETQFGPYPGGSTGYVTDVVPSAINYALETQDRSFFPNSASRSTAIHEHTHQWFGDGVSPGDWNDLWISEGTATFAENQTAYGSSGTSTTPNETSYYNAWSSSSPTAALWTTPSAGMTNASQLFGSQVYQRGSWTLEALRTVIGAPAFSQVMHEWQSRYQGTSRRTAAFIALAEEISGRSLTAFFQPWLYGTTKAPWPSRSTLTVAGPAALVSPGDPVSYTLTNRNTGKVTQAGSVVALDLTDVLDDATIGTLPANTTLVGSTLTWNVPSTAVAASSSVVVPLTVDPGAAGATLRAVASVSTLGGTCIDCTPTVTVGAPPVSPSPAPTVVGTATAGVPLGTGNTDTWPAGTSLTYQWTVDNTPVPGATSATFTPDVTHVGLAVRVQVTGALSDLSPVTTTSAPTANVVRATQTGSMPVISGTPQFGKPLTVDVGSWEPGTYFTYQWLTNGVNVAAGSGGTGPTFTPSVATQAGQTVTVSVTGTKAGQNSVARTSAATAGIAAGAFVLSPTPTISGAARALAPMTAVPGQWDDGTTLTYLWSVGGTPVAVGGTSAGFTPTLLHLGQTATVTVTGTKPGYPTTARTSAETAPIALALQVLSPTPVVTGTGKVGQTLTVEPGIWDVGSTQAVQWNVDGVPVDGATATTFTPLAGHLGAAVTASVTSTRLSYVPVTRTSLPRTVVPGDQALTPTPTVTGTPQVGQPLQAQPGTWDDGVVLGYQWAVDGTELLGATGDSYTPLAGDEGETVRVAVTGTRTGYATVTRTSAPTAAVSAGALALTPVPTVSGTARVGSLLTAVPGTWDTGTALGYQWQVAGEDVAGATGPAYAPVPADLGGTVTVEVTGSKPGYTSVTQESDPTTAVTTGLQGSTPAPTVSGAAKVGATLTANAGTWDDGVSLAYQWTLDGTDVDGATASTYVPGPGDLGSAVRVEVTGTRPGFDAVVRESDPTAAVGPGDLVSTPTPQLGGSAAKVGVQLTALPGTWDEGVSFGYQWTADGDDIPGATSATYTPVPGDVGESIAVEVTGTRTGYTAVTRTSPSTSGIEPGDLSLTPTPTVTGDPEVGTELTAVPGTWDPGVALAYQWALDGADVAGATATTYTPLSADAGRSVTVAVTGTRTGYAPVTRVSDPTAQVLIGDQTLTPRPSVTGTARVGDQLTAVPGTWDDGAVLSYQWASDGDDISGATAPAYTPAARDVGAGITVRVTGTRPGYSPASRTSDPTTAVARGVLGTTLDVRIKGTARAGRKLTAKVGSWPPGTTVTYAWTVKGVVKSRRSTLALKRGMTGRRVTLVVTVSRPGYVPQQDRARTSKVL